MPRVAFYRHERDDSPIVDDPSWEELAGVLGPDGTWEGPCTLYACAGHVCAYKMRSPRGVSAWSPVRIAPGGTRANRPCFLHRSVTTRCGRCNGECPRGEFTK